MEKIKIFKLQVEKKSIGNSIPELKGMQVFGSSERVIDGIEYSFIEYIPNWISTEINLKRIGDYIEVKTPYNDKDYIRDAFIEYQKQYNGGKIPSDEDCEKLVDKLFIELDSHRYKGILIEPVRHSLPKLFKELKFGRTCSDQKLLSECIDLYYSKVENRIESNDKNDKDLIFDLNGGVIGVIGILKTKEQYHNLHFDSIQFFADNLKDKKLLKRQITFDSGVGDKFFVADADTMDLYLYIDDAGTKQEPYLLKLLTLSNDYLEALEQIFNAEKEIVLISENYSNDFKEMINKFNEKYVK